MMKTALSIGLVFVGCVLLALALGGSAKACGICEEGSCPGSTVPPHLWMDPDKAATFCGAKDCDGRFCNCDCNVRANWKSCYCS